MQDHESHVVREMRSHLGRLRELGVDPYPRRFERSHTSVEIVSGFGELEGQEVAVAGRLTAVRGHGKAAFADLADGAGRIQLYVRSDVVGDEQYAMWRLFDVGDIVGARGRVMKTKTGEISVKAENLVLLAKALRPLPEKWHGLKDKEARYRRRYLDLIANEESRRRFLVRSAVLKAVRSFLDGRGFLEVETPILQPIYGGAFARPFVTRHHALGMDLYLRIADELYLKRLVVGGFERVYEIGKDFRNEGMDRTHSPEFTQLELYQAYADYDDMMRLTEELICRTAEEVFGSTTVVWQGREIDLTPPWRRLTVREAVESAVGSGAYESADALAAAAAGAGLDLPDPPTFGRLVEKVLSDLVEPDLMEATFLIGYPREISPLAKQTPDDPETVERFELFVGGLELANSFSELNDPDEQRVRFEEQAESRERGVAEAHGMDEDFVRALEHGMPPTGGLGIGIDRLVMLLTDSWNIRDVILFPAMRPEE